MDTTTTTTNNNNDNNEEEKQQEPIIVEEEPFLKEEETLNINKENALESSVKKLATDMKASSDGKLGLSSSNTSDTLEKKKSKRMSRFLSAQPGDATTSTSKETGFSSDGALSSTFSANASRRQSTLPQFGFSFGKVRQFWKDLDKRKAKPVVEVSAPTDFKHVAHVAFDPKNLTYSGLPEEWREKDKQIYTQFGCSIQSCQRIAVDGYNERIPAVLVQLRDQLNLHNGLKVEGVFRVAASYDDQLAYKKELDTGTFKGCKTTDDVMCMAALIKEWFRTMPVRLLNSMPLDCIKTGKCELDKDLPEPNLSIFYWFIDLMAETVELEEFNRMNAKAMAIVIAPNLYSTYEKALPQEIMQEMSGAVSIVEAELTKRLRQRQDARAAEVLKKKGKRPSIVDQIRSTIGAHRKSSTGMMNRKSSSSAAKPNP